MSWIFLIISGLFEVMGVLIFKQLSLAKGKKILLWVLALACVFALSLGSLSLAMREIDMSVAYAVWTGIGASGGVIMASILYREKITPLKAICLALIIGSMVGLKFLS